MSAGVGYEPTPCRIASQAFTAPRPEIARPLSHGGRSGWILICSATFWVRPRQRSRVLWRVCLHVRMYVSLSLFVSLSVPLSSLTEHISQVHIKTSPNFLRVLPGGVAMYYILPVMWMTSSLRITTRNMWRERVTLAIYQEAALDQERSLISVIAYIFLIK